MGLQSNIQYSLFNSITDAMTLKSLLFNKTKAWASSSIFLRVTDAAGTYTS